MTKLVHGEEALEQAIKISAALFSGSVAELTASEIEQGFKDVPSVERTAEDTVLIDLLRKQNLSSKRQAREDVTNGAIYVNGERTQALDYVVTEKTASKVNSQSFAAVKEIFLNSLLIRNEYKQIVPQIVG